MKYNIKSIDYTGCHPVIAEHLRRNVAIECIVWDNQKEAGEVVFVVGYDAHRQYSYRGGDKLATCWQFAEPITRKARRIMPPERAIPVLIANGYEFEASAPPDSLYPNILPMMFSFMGRVLDGEAERFVWPDCIIEECNE